VGHPNLLQQKRKKLGNEEWKKHQKGSRWLLLNLGSQSSRRCGLGKKGEGENSRENGRLYKAGTSYIMIVGWGSPVTNGRWDVKLRGTWGKGSW